MSTPYVDSLQGGLASHKWPDSVQWKKRGTADDVVKGPFATTFCRPSRHSVREVYFTGYGGVKTGNKKQGQDQHGLGCRELRSGVTGSKGREYCISVVCREDNEVLTCYSVTRVWGKCRNGRGSPRSDRFTAKKELENATICNLRPETRRSVYVARGKESRFCYISTACPCERKPDSVGLAPLLLEY